MNQGLPILTPRELEILELVALGHSAKEIALRNDVTHRTVETQLDIMRLKLRARNRTHMVAIAMSSRLLDQGFGWQGAELDGFGFERQPMKNRLDQIAPAFAMGIAASD